MQLVFMGTPEIAVPALEALIDAGHFVTGVFTQPDRAAGRGHKLVEPAVKQAATRHGIPVFQPVKVKTEETRQLFASLEPEAAVVFAYGRILPPGLLAVPRYGCINIHASLLPAYRGAAPIQWAIARGETETGVTTMLMDEGLDTGDILLQRATPIGIDETAPELAERLSALGAELIVETLSRIDEITPQPQDADRATLAPILSREDGQIDWEMDAREIANRSRGFQPWPGIWTTWQGARLQIWRAEALEPDESEPLPVPDRVFPARRGPVPVAESNPAPGTVLAARHDLLVIACGKGTHLQAHELQLEGKRRMPARDIINGLRLSAGDRFGGGESE